jgi:hypothetical protein
MRARGKENVIPSNTKENCDKKTCFIEYINEIGRRVGWQEAKKQRPLKVRTDLIYINFPAEGLQFGPHS